MSAGALPPTSSGAQAATTVRGNRGTRMTAGTLSGIHSSGFALDRPLDGVPDLPPRLRDLLIDARFRAAERVFGTAISHGAELILLAGDILSSDSGPGSRGPWFLREQFRRLETHGIHVVWAEPTAGLHRWIETHVGLPGNVTLLSEEASADLVLSNTTVRVHCRTSPSSLAVPKGGADWNLIVVPGLAVDPGLIRWADYVALGGPMRDSLHANVFAAGAPQGSGFDEAGIHGCLGFSLAAGRPPQTEFIAADVVRWVEEEHAVLPGTTADGLRSQLTHRLEEFSSAHSCDAWIARWTLDPQSPDTLAHCAADRLRSLQQDLQRVAAATEIPFWPASLSARFDSTASRFQASLPETLATILDGCRDWSAEQASAHDLVALTAADGLSVPDALRFVTPSQVHRSLQSRLSAEAVRVLAVHGFTALR